MEGGGGKVDALTEVRLALSNYRRADAFCTVNKRRRGLGASRALIGPFQLTALVLERCQLHTKARRSAVGWGGGGV